MIEQDMISAASKLLDVKPDVLQAFDFSDPYNEINKSVVGVICRQSDHRYGALVIFTVNGRETTQQVIYCTPKLHYPFSSNPETGERKYHWPDFTDVEIYEKLDGTSICAYSYADADGKRYVTFKTRLTPVLGQSKFGDFKGLWDEVLAKNPNIRCPVPVATGDWTYIFELYGYKNLILVLYKEPIAARLLFKVLQSNAKAYPPECKTMLNGLRDSQYDPLEPLDTLAGGSKENITTLYESWRKQAEQKNNEMPGTMLCEGYVFYTRDNTDKWSMWKCLDGRSCIYTDSGPIKLSHIVTSKYCGNVLTLLENGKFGYGKVCGWYRNKLENRTMVRVQFKTRKRGYGVNVTEDHLFLTRCGWKKAKNLTNIDMVCSNELGPNSMQMDLINGTLLGDATISVKSPRLVFSHTMKDRQYIINKIEALGCLIKNVNSITPVKYSSSGTKPFMYAKTHSTLWVREQRNRWYFKNKKRVPKDISLTDITLAIWYMDDGYLSKHNKGTGHIILATNAFSTKDVEFLCGKLVERGIDCKITTQNTIFIDVKNSEKFLELTGRFIVPCMDRKRLENTPTYNPDSWNLGEEKPFWSNVVILPSTLHKNDKSVYCIDVEKTHNFVTLGGVVHNCKPPQIEDIHWTSDTIEAPSIFITARNALENKSPEELTPEFVSELLKEEYTEQQVLKSWDRIEKITKEVVSQAKFARKVRDVIVQCPEDVKNSGKAPIMRWVSQYFDRNDMKRVFSVLKIAGFVQ